MGVWASWLGAVRTTTSVSRCSANNYYYRNKWYCWEHCTQGMLLLSARVLQQNYTQKENGRNFFSAFFLVELGVLQCTSSPTETWADLLLLRNRKFENSDFPDYCTDFCSRLLQEIRIFFKTFLKILKITRCPKLASLLFLNLSMNAPFP